MTAVSLNLSHPFGPSSTPFQRCDQVIRRNITERCYNWASFLREPVCWTHKKFVLNGLAKDTSKAFRCAMKALLYISFVLTGIPAALSLPFSFLGKMISVEDFSFSHNETVKISDPQKRELSIFNWNICAIFGGYPLTKGGVDPWEKRIEGITEKIRKTDADIVVLEEVYDRAAAQAIRDRIKDQYPFVFDSMGIPWLAFYLEDIPVVPIMGTGTPSGVFVASKYPLYEPSFTQFPKSTSIGWQMKLNGRGWFSAKVKLADKQYVGLNCTHLQHSEDDHKATPDEEKARATQIKLILDSMNLKEEMTEVLLGDLNMGGKELEGNLKGQNFQGHSIKPTCARDRLAAQKKGCQIDEEPVAIDHILVKNGSAETKVIEPMSESVQLSDHSALFSTIKV